MEGFVLEVDGKSYYLEEPPRQTDAFPQLSFAPASGKHVEVPFVFRLIESVNGLLLERCTMEGEPVRTLRPLGVKGDLDGRRLTLDWETKIHPQLGTHVIRAGFPMHRTSPMPSLPLEDGDGSFAPRGFAFTQSVEMEIAESAQDSSLKPVGSEQGSSRQFPMQTNGDVRVILLGVHPTEEPEVRNRKAQPGVLVRYICERPLGTKFHLGSTRVLQGEKQLKPPEGIPSGGRGAIWNFDWVQQQGVSPLPDLPKSRERYRIVKEDFKRGIYLPDGSVGVHIQCGADDELQEWTFHDVKIGEFTKSWDMQFKEQQETQKTNQTKASASESSLPRTNPNAGEADSTVSLTVFVSQDGTYRVNGRVVGKEQLSNRVVALLKRHSVEVTVVAPLSTSLDRVIKLVDFIQAIPPTNSPPKGDYHWVRDRHQLKVNLRTTANAAGTTDPTSYLAKINRSDLADEIEAIRGDWAAGEPLLAL